MPGFPVVLHTPCGHVKGSHRGRVPFGDRIGKCPLRGAHAPSARRCRTNVPERGGMWPIPWPESQLRGSTEAVAYPRQCASRQFPFTDDSISLSRYRTWRPILWRGTRFWSSHLRSEDFHIPLPRNLHTVSMSTKGSNAPGWRALRYLALNRPDPQPWPHLPLQCIQDRSHPLGRDAVSGVEIDKGIPLAAVVVRLNTGIPVRRYRDLRVRKHMVPLLVVGACMDLPQ